MGLRIGQPQIRKCIALHSSSYKLGPILFHNLIMNSDFITYKTYFLTPQTKCLIYISTHLYIVLQTQNQ